MLALETRSPTVKKPSFFRRFSRRPKQDAQPPAPPSPKIHSSPTAGKLRRHLTETSKGLRTHTVLQRRSTTGNRQSLKSQPPQFVFQCFELPANDPPKYHHSCVELPAHIPPTYHNSVELPASYPSKQQFSVELPAEVPLKSHSSIELPRRILPSALPTCTFSGASTIRPWDLALTPSQTSALYLGFEPHDLSDKWFIYSEGPDRSGKLKVHFHRSRTGMKIAQLFMVMDMRGKGSGKIVGIKWNADRETNYMNEHEAKYMVRMICVWSLGVELGQGESAL